VEYEIDTWAFSDPDGLLERGELNLTRKPGTDQRSRPCSPHAIEQHALFIPEEAEESV
jgi:hypothetical protein